MKSYEKVQVEVRQEKMMLEDKVERARKGLKAQQDFLSKFTADDKGTIHHEEQILFEEELMIKLNAAELELRLFSEGIQAIIDPNGWRHAVEKKAQDGRTANQYVEAARKEMGKISKEWSDLQNAHHVMEASHFIALARSFDTPYEVWTKLSGELQVIMRGHFSSVQEAK